MRVLFVHQNFPGQYKHLAAALGANSDNQIISLSINQPPIIAGVQSFRYQPTRGTTPQIHAWVAETETKVIRGEAVARAALHLRQQGFIPDVICVHPGWGEALFLKDVFPEAKVLAFIEFYYGFPGSDTNFDPEFRDNDFDSLCRLRMKNVNHLLSLDLCDWGVSPTRWQWQSVPEIYRSKISVIHDGIDTDLVRPNPEVTLTLEKAGVTMNHQDEIVTFVNRNLEPYRGFHIFMRALPEILHRRPQARVLIVGGDDVSYGKRLPEGQTYRQKYLAEVGSSLDLSRVHFLGRIPYNTFVNFLQLSAVHVYLTYPFVLSWSMLEAMSAGCLVIGSATAPVREVIEDGVNGLLVDFFSPEQIADAVDRVLDHPNRMQSIREQARQTILERYDLKRICLPKHIELVKSLAGNKLSSI
ncbi:glycosyl transferase group 1 [Gloeothece citriformis PCC 7424]|uniref:Glycosyl transferase group 1 n=1 Tax=Gloeothece citriformis (strain PCC 7424) TaxID=65393 RepID=B7K7D3_GLOC7|nr:glycosyltransferase family 4 protein [Gloeothece citriformis]ACK69701.1 glycosyl transferase group 1 [Gloeothece citriformis PCC 7424]